MSGGDERWERLAAILREVDVALRGPADPSVMRDWATMADEVERLRTRVATLEDSEISRSIPWDRIDQAEAKVGRLTRERDDAIREIGEMARESVARDLALARLEAEVAALRDRAARLEDVEHDELADLRAERRALYAVVQAARANWDALGEGAWQPALHALGDEMTFTKRESIYDSEISPLMAKIIAVCAEHDIPFVFSAQLNDDRIGDADENDDGDPLGPFYCTSAHVPIDSGEKLTRALDALRPTPAAWAAFVQVDGQPPRQVAGSGFGVARGGRDE